MGNALLRTFTYIFPGNGDAASGSESVTPSPQICLDGATLNWPQRALGILCDPEVKSHKRWTGAAPDCSTYKYNDSYKYLFYQSITGLWDFICIPLMISLYTILSPLFYLSLVNWVLWLRSCLKRQFLLLNFRFWLTSELVQRK